MPPQSTGMHRRDCSQLYKVPQRTLLQPAAQLTEEEAEGVRGGLTFRCITDLKACTGVLVRETLDALCVTPGGGGPTQ